MEAIDIPTLERLLQSPNDVMFIDVRSREEFRNGYILGFSNIPLESVLEDLEVYKSSKIVFSCAAGIRCRKAAKLLSPKLRTQSIYYFKDSLDRWVEAGNLLEV